MNNTKDIKFCINCEHCIYSKNSKLKYSKCRLNEKNTESDLENLNYLVTGKHISLPKEFFFCSSVRENKYSLICDFQPKKITYSFYRKLILKSIMWLYNLIKGERNEKNVIVL